MNLPYNAVAELVPHDGGFHADDVLAMSVLLDLCPGAAAYRTRDPAMTCAAPGRIVVDVGYVHDPKSGLFDHHQNGAPTREDGTTYSAFGLVWRHCGRDWLRYRGATETAIDTIFDQIDQSVVYLVDRIDNGHMSPIDLGPGRSMSIFQLIEDLHPAFDERDEISLNEAFDQAVGVASSFLGARTDSLLAEQRCRSVVSEAVDHAAGRAVIELPGPMNFDDAIHAIGADQVEFVAYPRGSEWCLSGVAEELGSYARRRDLPENWAGLSGEELEKATGVAGSIFCHKKRFIIVADSRDAVMSLAGLAMEDGVAPLVG